MSDPQYVVVVEAGLCKNSYGADIRCSDPMGADAANAYFVEVVEGQHPELFHARPGTSLLRITGTQLVAVLPHRMQPDELTRLTLTELVRTF